MLDYNSCISRLIWNIVYLTRYSSSINATAVRVYNLALPSSPASFGVIDYISLWMLANTILLSLAICLAITINKYSITTNVSSAESISLLYSTSPLA